jgi:hypothetical protein
VSGKLWRMIKIQSLLVASNINDFSSKIMFLNYSPQSSFANWWKKINFSGLNVSNTHSHAKIL